MPNWTDIAEDLDNRCREIAGECENICHEKRTERLKLRRAHATIGISQFLLVKANTNGYEFLRHDQGEPLLGGGDGEFVWDYVWYNQNDGRITLVDLAAEVEFGSGTDVAGYDFQKLLISPASLRIMVFQKKANDVKLVNDEVNNLVNKYIVNYEQHHRTCIYYIGGFWNVFQNYKGGFYRYNGDLNQDFDNFQWLKPWL